MIKKAKYINKKQDGVLITFVDNTTFLIPTFAYKYRYTDTYNEWVQLKVITEPFQTNKEIEAQRVQNIIAKADQIIEATYSPKKQRKLASIYNKLQDKRIDKILLTENEMALQKRCKDADKWVSSIREIENIAIQDVTPLDSIVWKV